MDGQIKIDKIEEYEKDLKIYEAFCNKVKTKLVNILSKHSIHYLTTCSRVKKIDSVIQKLQLFKIEENQSIRKIDDLIGCRVIFYLDSEITKFFQFLHNEFDIVKSNIRHSEDGYNAHHLVVKLKNEQLSATEWTLFEGILCEIQLTTVLFHAWSEISHKITYKSTAELKQFNPETLNSIDYQLKDIMKNFIKPANYRFEFINSEYVNLQNGVKIFDIKFLNLILESKDLNEMYERLSLLAQNVSKYGDKFPLEIKSIDFLKSVIVRSKKLKSKIDRTFGFGYEHHHIINECIEMSNYIKYKYPQQVFALLVDLALNKNKQIKDKAENHLRNMCKYYLKVLQQVGISVQCLILDEVKKWSKVKKLNSLRLLKIIFSEILKLEYEDTSMNDYNSISYGHGLLKAEDQLKNIRDEVIQFLMDLFSEAIDVNKMISIIELLNESTNTPYRGNYGDEIEEMVKNNTKCLIQWYLSILDQYSLPFEVMKEIDKQVKWFKKRHGTIKEIFELERNLHSNYNYNVFRVLVGYDHDYSEEMEWNEAKIDRTIQIEKFSKDITKENQKDWMEIIIRIMKSWNISNQGEYVYFHKFLYSTALVNPEFAKLLIENMENLLKNVMHHLIAGLWDSEINYAKSKVNQWINVGENLLDCVGIYFYSDVIELPISILSEISVKAIERKNTAILNEIVRIITKSKSNSSENKQIFLITINSLSILKNYCWTNYLWLEKDSILNSFDESEEQLVLISLLNCPQIDYHVEQILIPIAESNPIKILQFFEKRIQIENRKKNVWKKNYDALPYKFEAIGEILRKKGDIIIPVIFLWFKKRHWKFQWIASNILQKIFPTFDVKLEKYLLNVLSSKKAKDAKIILNILKQYNGDHSMHKVCQEFVVVFNSNSELIHELMIIMSGTGILQGEYGSVDAYSQKRKEIGKWKKSKNIHIKAFVKEYYDFLNKRINSDKKRIDAEVHLRKLEFDFETH
ncbi:RelA/SpoT domain-containing protein [Bacillus sp. AFS088145]|uniref:GTP pyrophosphokinase n=1 Tax=Bacillus sp. AFS088145 TaxID=2033514 RepID=UPI000BF5D5DC|nr:RelA/SpoT domain-containing protein [Bacillus sp. AFS088145]PFH91398.1 hypothetical protein COI44_01980 [Bacillus sp. AFS088145]